MDTALTRLPYFLASVTVAVLTFMLYRMPRRYVAGVRVCRSRQCRDSTWAEQVVLGFCGIVVMGCSQQAHKDNVSRLAFPFRPGYTPAMDYQWVNNACHNYYCR